MDDKDRIEEIKQDCERILPALRAWFDSQGIDEKRSLTTCGMHIARSMGRRAGTRDKLIVGLALFCVAMEIAAKQTYEETHPND